MKQEDKDLLLTYLSMALPYGVVIKITSDGGMSEVSYNIKLDVELLADLLDTEDDFKPYLRPLSSMTEEEEKEFNDQMYKAKPYSDGKSYNVYEVIGLDIIYLNAYHFDYLGLIPKGLAIAITEENNPYK